MKRTIALLLGLLMLLPAFYGCDVIGGGENDSLSGSSQTQESTDEKSTESDSKEDGSTEQTTEQTAEPTTEQTAEPTTEQTTEQTTEPMTEESSSTEEITESSAQDVQFGYTEVIDMFRSIVDYYPTHDYYKVNLDDSDGTENVPDELIDIYKRVFISGFLRYRRDYFSEYMHDGRNYFGYALYDVNNNGNEELILLNDRYSIVAVFTLIDGKAELLFDNYSSPELRLDGDGKIYATKSEDGDAYSWIYILNDGDTPELVKAYHCVKAIYTTSDECYDVTGEERVRVPRSEWEEVAHGRLFNDDAGRITRSSTSIEFVRLFEELHLYTPTGYGFTWSSYYFEDNVNCLDIGNLSPETVKIGLCNTTVNTSSIWYEHIFTATATVEGNVAYFETENISGRVEFGLDTIWLIVEESSIEGVPCGAFIYTEYSSMK